jgi:hypothetical protein
MKRRIWAEVPPSKRAQDRQWAIAQLVRCKEGRLARNSPEFRKASRIVGSIVTMRIVDDSLVTSKCTAEGARSSDALFRRAPGCYGGGRRA